MSEVKVNKVSPRSGTTVTIGDSGDTINLVGTLQNNGSPLTGDISSVVAGTGLSGGATSGVATLNIEAAQPTITSLGTITSFTSTGIDDNATSTAITIDSSENIGIGISSPGTLLDLQLNSSNTNTAANAMFIRHNTSGTSAAGFGTNIRFYGERADGNDQSMGKIGFTASTNTSSNMSSDFTVQTSTSGSDSEKMRINSDGRLLVGKTDTLRTTVGSEIRPGFIRSTASGGHSLDIVRTSDQGDAIRIYSENNLVGVLGTEKWGIGTASPSQELDVVGNAEINGNIYNNGKLNIRKDGASEREHIVITNEQGGSNSSPTYRDIHFNGYSGKDRGRITVQDRSDNKVGGFMELQTARSETTDGSGLKTSIFLDNDGDIFFYEDTGTTAKVKWDATNERFGIGTSSPSEALDVTGNINLTDSLLIDGAIQFPAIKSSNQGNESIYKPANYSIGFNTNGGETMRITDGMVRMLMGDYTANPSGSNQGITFRNNGSTARVMELGISATGNSTVVQFYNGNGGVGNIQLNGSATAYNTSSDYRLKENVDYTFDATTRLKQLKPARFNFIADDTKTVDGFIAHEVSSVVPEAISGEKDAIKVWQEGEELPEGVAVGDNKLDADGNTIPDYQGIDQSKLVPLLVKTIQELEARITTLENV